MWYANLNFIDLFLNKVSQLGQDTDVHVDEIIYWPMKSNN